MPACRCLVAAAVAVAVAACSSVDRPVSGQAARPIPGENKPYPNLASVPERPRVTPREERERIAQGLAADRTHSNYSEDVIPRQMLPGDGQPPAPRAVPPAAAPAPAPATPAVPRPSQGATPRPEAPPASAVQTSEIPPPVLPPEPEAPAPLPASTPVAPAAASAAPVQASALPPPLLPAAPATPVTPLPPPAEEPTRLTPMSSPSTQLSEPVVPPAPLPEPVVPPPPAAATPSPAVPPVGGTPAWPPDRRERSTLPEERPNRGLRNDRYMPPTLSPGPAPSPGAPPILSPVPGRSEAAPDDGRPTMLAAHSAAGAAAALRTGRAMRLATVGFGSGSARLDRGDRAAIDQIASIHRRRGGLVVVVGHASREAGDARLLHERIANLNVSLDRANAVARALQQAGVPADSIRVEARGDSEPAVAATTAAAEAANRRVEIFIDF
ncbi:MAG: OmpA family protein [Rhodospirillales bacterium]